MTTGVGARKKVSVPAEEVGAFNRALIATIWSAPARTRPPRSCARRCSGWRTRCQRHPGVRPELAERLVAALNGREHPASGCSARSARPTFPRWPTSPTASSRRWSSRRRRRSRSSTRMRSRRAWRRSRWPTRNACSRTMDVAGALDLEAFAANLTLLHPAVAEVRPYPGLAESLARLRGSSRGSSLWEPGAARNLQDPLSFRGLPAAARSPAGRALLRARPARHRAERVAGEPARRPRRGPHRLGRQLRDPPLAAALDFLRIALAPALTGSAERLLKLLQGPLSGLPDGLAPRQGLAENSLSEHGDHRAGADRGGAPPRSARLLRAGDDHAGGGDRGPDDDGPARCAPAGRDGRARRVGGRIELVVAAQAVDLARRPASGAARPLRTGGCVRSSRSSPRATPSFRTSSPCET